MKEKGNFTLVSLVSLIAAIFFGCQKQENNKNPTIRCIQPEDNIL